MAGEKHLAEGNSTGRAVLRRVSYALFAVALIVALVGFFGSRQLVQWSGIAACSWANVGVWIARGEGVRAAFLGAVVMTVAAVAIIVFRV